MEKDLRSRKNRELKKEKNFIKLEERKIRGGKNSKREKFGEGFKEEEKSRGEKEKILDETLGGKNLEKNLRSGKNRELKKEKNSKREKLEKFGEGFKEQEKSRGRKKKKRKKPEEGKI